MTVISHMALRLPTGLVLPARPAKAFVSPLSSLRLVLIEGLTTASNDNFLLTLAEHITVEKKYERYRYGE